jgi:uncharacterized protein YcsI (UPF0317 family)
MANDWSRVSGKKVREACRRGEFTRPTAGVALGYVQANLVILREPVAGDFERFCNLNRAPCPLLEKTAPGQYEPCATAPGADLRTDLPRYRVLREGLCTARPTSIVKEWDEAEGDGKGRLVAFLIGCSFTFETALLSAGLPVRHIEQGCNVPMYKTSISCATAGVFGGPLVVSMRPMKPEQARQAAEITAKLPQAHGAPVHVGNPQAIGIHDLGRPDYGDAVPLHPAEIPVFWACGVTPLEALMQAKLDLAITHEPGHMFITDLRE